MQPLSLYIHIPFCRAKCAYCDFASYSGREGDWQAYFSTLLQEIEASASAEHRVETIFFGGGTPSLVPAEYIAGALAAARRAFAVSERAEITLEANPGTLSAEKLAAYRGMGVNRLSIGVQSFDAALLRDLGRIHSPEEAEDAVRLARAAGFSNISLDLMYALPGQTETLWKETLARAIALGPEHISAYSLIVEEGTPMAARMAELPDDDIAIAMQRMATATFAKAGYSRYEISNYARPGFACRHNIVYWKRGEYLGFGCAAHSLFGGERFENPAVLAEYLAGGRGLNRARIGAAEAEEERIFLGTRMVEGIATGGLLEGRARAIGRLVDNGLAEIYGDRFHLTERGLELQSAAAFSLIDDG